jgi:hypothetical protein
MPLRIGLTTQWIEKRTEDLEHDSAILLAKN